MWPWCSTPSAAAARFQWWITKRKVAERHVKEAKASLSTTDAAQNQAALSSLEAAIALYPRWEAPLHLKATVLLRLRRYRDLVDLLRDDLPEDSPLSSSVSSTSSSDSLSRESVNLLNQAGSGRGKEATMNPAQALTRCLSVRFLGGRGEGDRHTHRQHWRYIILGQALSHLGLLKDSLYLLQAGKRLASASSRRESVLFPEDLFATAPDSTAPDDLETVAQLIANLKFLLRRRAAAMAALDAGIPTEAIRHFSKILDGSRRAVPQAFLAECYMHRAAAYQTACRLAESIADCNRALSLDPMCIGALSTRAAIFERTRCYTECLQDLEHLKLLYDSILRDRWLLGSAWRRLGCRCNTSDAATRSREVAAKIAKLKELVVAGEVAPADHFALLGLRRLCTRSELECAYRLLCLRHRPERSAGFIDRCEFADDRDVERVRDQARMSGLLLYRLLQKAYAHVMTTVMEVEAAEKQKQPILASSAGTAVSTRPRPPPPSPPPTFARIPELRRDVHNCHSVNLAASPNNREEALEKPTPVAVRTALHCRETAGVGGLHRPSGFVHSVHHLHQALSC